MAKSSNNIEDLIKSSASTSGTNLHKAESEWWLKSLQKENFNNDNYIITNLVAELAILLNDKIRLEGENAVLQIENEDLRKKQNEIETINENNKSDLLKKIKSLEDTIKKYDFNCKQIDINHLEEIKNYISEISILKEQYYGLKEVSDKSTYDFKTLITDLEKELQSINLDNSELLEEIKMCKSRNQKYKEKLKASTNMIDKLNNVIATFINKVVVNKKIQTDDVNNMHMEPIKDDYDHEKILSELFFKQNPCDIIDSVLLQGNPFERDF